MEWKELQPQCHEDCHQTLAIQELELNFASLCILSYRKAGTGSFGKGVVHKNNRNHEHHGNHEVTF